MGTQTRNSLRIMCWCFFGKSMQIPNSVVSWLICKTDTDTGFNSVGIAIGAHIVTLHSLIFVLVSNQSPLLCRFFSHSWFWCCNCNFLRGYKAYHADIGLHIITVFELITRLSKLGCNGICCPGKSFTRKKLIRASEKGVGGRPEVLQNSFPEVHPPSPKGRKGQRVRKSGLNLWHGSDWFQTYMRTHLAWSGVLRYAGPLFAGVIRACKPRALFWEDSRPISDPHPAPPQIC